VSSLVRLVIALLSVSTVLLVSVPAVEAATVSMTAEQYVDVTLTYQAAPGESNRLVVTMTADRGGWIVSETGSDASGPLALTAGPGCTSLNPQIAVCEHHVEDVSQTPFHVVIVLGDDSDGAWASSACGLFWDLPCQTRISGGEERDVVFANDGQGETYPSVVYGGPGTDHLVAGEAGSRLIGGLGDDRLIGGAGRDMISGGGGKDRITGGLRSDELRGGAGADTFYARDGFRDRVFGGKGRDSARVDRRLDRVRSIARFF
jgi:RTX calcium-binding nonapeptide repeat (4 copies)